MRDLFKKAFVDTLPVMAGYLILGMGFGLLMSTNGFSPIHSMLMSVFIYAGSLQYLGIGLMSAGTSLISIAISSFLVNARHILYGISMFSKYSKVKKHKPYLIFALTDETYSLVCDETNENYFFFVSLLDHIYWISGTILGCFIGSIITFNTSGLDFALTALFIVIFLEQWLNSKDTYSALSGLVITSVCLLFFGKEDFLIPSMALIVIALLARKKIKHE